MTQRITLRLDQDIYDYLMTRAPGPRQISELVNPLLRSAIDQERTWHETQPGLWKRTEVYPWGLVTGEIAYLPTAGAGVDPLDPMRQPYFVRQAIQWTDPRLSNTPAPIRVQLVDTLPEAHTVYDQWTADAAATYAALTGTPV